MTSIYRLSIFASLSAGLIFIDQFSKYLIRQRGGFYICNQGIAFGIKINWLAAFLFLVIAIFVIFLKIQDTINLPAVRLTAVRQINSRFHIPMIKPFNSLKNWLLYIVCFLFLSDWSLRLGIILVTSGAISNIIDRLHFGCVIDFIDLSFWPVFNLADIYITMGSIGLLFILLRKND